MWKQVLQTHLLALTVIRFSVFLGESTHRSPPPPARFNHLVRVSLGSGWGLRAGFSSSCVHIWAWGCVCLSTCSQGLETLPLHSPGRLPSHCDYNHSQPGTLTKHHIPPPWTTPLFDLLSGDMGQEEEGEGQSAGACGTLPFHLPLI